MLHLLFVLAVIVIGIALLPMALAVLPWLVVGALSVAVFAGLLLFVVMAPQAAATVAVLTAIVALLLRTGQAAHGWSRRADRAWGRRLGKEPPLLPTPDHEPRSEARLAKAAEELHAAAVEHLGLLEREVKQAQESIAPAIERRKTLAESLQLANRVHTVAADVRYYPSWSKNAPALVCDLVSTVSVQEQSVNEWLVIFDLQGRRYSIEHERHWFISPLGEDTGPYYGHIKLCDVDGTELFKARFSEGEYGGREFLEVSAFRSGVWVEGFITLSERMDVLKREQSLRRELDDVRRERERFGLDAKE